MTEPKNPMAPIDDDAQRPALEALMPLFEKYAAEFQRVIDDLLGIEGTP